jgi:hypothetical protein
MKLHYKYLLRPNVKPEIIGFDGKRFGCSPDELVQVEYMPGRTLQELVATANRYAGAEKRGVHAIAKANTNVVDLEIAFSRGGQNVAFAEPGDDAPMPEQPNKRSQWSTFRMDLAAVHPGGPTGARVVFFEAKCADNVELWELTKKVPSEPPVIKVDEQIRRYELFLKNAEASLIKAYTNLCKQLIDFQKQGWVRKPDALVARVANNELHLSSSFFGRGTNSVRGG